MEILQLSPAIVALVPVVMGITTVLKNFIDSRYSPIVALALGVAGSFLFPGATLAATIVSGIVVGLTASGVYSGVKSVASA